MMSNLKDRLNENPNCDEPVLSPAARIELLKGMGLNKSYLLIRVEEFEAIKASIAIRRKETEKILEVAYMAKDAVEAAADAPDSPKSPARVYQGRFLARLAELPPRPIASPFTEP